MHEETMSERKTDLILGQPIEVGKLQVIAKYIVEQAELRRPFYVCFTTAHMLVESLRKSRIRAAYARAEMVLPDGVPVAWCLHALGHTDADCISGPRLMPLLLREAARTGVSVGFYGGEQKTLDRMTANIAAELPALKMVYVCSPPFRPILPEEQQVLLIDIEASGTEMLFIGLGSPKQDLWMYNNAHQLPCVCLGVGAAFQFLSGEKYLPPNWVQQLGLTWLVRLCQEPRRLLVRNLYSPVFVFLFLMQRLMGKRFDRIGIDEPEAQNAGD
jgi:N-acetylglucosaminyldiphosphoundecaprenol N-acetyl-beta-D-mannosaminyltransferase